MKSQITCMLVALMCGCGGAEFAGGVDVPMGADAAKEASEVDTQTGQDNANPNGSPDGRVDVPTDAGADMQAEGEASTPFEASTDVGVVAEGGFDGGDGGQDEGGSPSCGDDEVYPHLSHTCQEYIKTTQWPLYTGCCQSNHTCGMVLGGVGMMTCRPFPQ